MRPALVNAFAVMLPRLQAEETLMLRAAVASGTGSMKPEADREWLKAMQKQSGAPAGRRIRTLDDLRSIGIPVKGGE